MDFLRVLDTVCGSLDRDNVRYALIGGFAMAMRGVQRATVDLDFILLLDHLTKADDILISSGYRRVFRSENVSHYRADASEFGRVDLLHAFRGPSLSMLDRAERLEVSAGLTVPVARVEDIIGLKVQAAVNDSRRATHDWLDIRMLLEAAHHRRQELDWMLIGDYLDIFSLNDQMEILRGWYGAPE